MKYLSLVGVHRDEGDRGHPALKKGQMGGRGDLAWLWGLLGMGEEKREHQQVLKKWKRKGRDREQEET
jgi:hypothetical protein